LTAGVVSGSTLTACIRERRGCRVDIKVPIYRDEKTPRPFVEVCVLMMGIQTAGIAAST
jgi:hypothetical protein